MQIQRGIRVLVVVVLPLLPLLAVQAPVTEGATAAPGQMGRGRGPPRSAAPPASRPADAERAAARRAAVTVTKNPPSVEEREFVNRTKLPPDIRRAVQAHQAWADSQFLLRPEIKDALQDQQKVLRRVRATFRIESVAVALDMKTTLWLPPQASKKLRDHEEGHRRISERFYETAEAKARQAAEKLVGVVYPGEGHTLEEARQAALESAGRDLVQTHFAQTQWASGRVHELYDKLTRHSTNTDLSEEEAIRRAFEQYEQEKQAREGPGKTKR